MFTLGKNGAARAIHHVMGLCQHGFGHVLPLWVARLAISCQRGALRATAVFCTTQPAFGHQLLHLVGRALELIVFSVLESGRIDFLRQLGNLSHNSRAALVFSQQHSCPHCSQRPSADDQSSQLG